MDIKGKWALVTGASGGLGEAFARALADKGSNLVLAARSADKLEAVAEKLRAASGVEVVTLAVDLAEPDAASRLIGLIEDKGVHVDILVNNAGLGLHGDFLDRPCAETVGMLQLNIIALTELTHAVAARMAKRGGGHILLVASMTAFMPTPGYAAYAASKAYVRQFGEALHAELAGRNVTVTVVSPGLMDTGFLGAAGHAPSASMRRVMIAPELVARIGLDALFARRQSVVAGTMNKVMAFATRLLPRSMQTRLAGDSMKS